MKNNIRQCSNNWCHCDVFKNLPESTIVNSRFFFLVKYKRAIRYSDVFVINVNKGYFNAKIITVRDITVYACEAEKGESKNDNNKREGSSKNQSTNGYNPTVQTVILTLMCVFLILLILILIRVFY